VLFLSLAWRCDIAITNSQVQCQTSCLHIISKPLDGNIYKQWELGQVMVIKLVIDFGELVKVVLKRWGEGSGIGAAGFCNACVCLGVFLLL
jgi:hypothetical protein